jgi:hypothetical protein
VLCGLDFLKFYFVTFLSPFKGDPAKREGVCLDFQSALALSAGIRVISGLFSFNRKGRKVSTAQIILIKERKEIYTTCPSSCPRWF